LGVELPVGCSLLVLSVYLGIPALLYISQGTGFLVGLQDRSPSRILMYTISQMVSKPVFIVLYKNDDSWDYLFVFYRSK
jgi:hypothetical protein